MSKPLPDRAARQVALHSIDYLLTISPGPSAEDVNDVAWQVGGVAMMLTYLGGDSEAYAALSDRLTRLANERRDDYRPALALLRSEVEAGLLSYTDADAAS